MRVCILGNARAIHTRRWARAYAERGHDVHVLSIRRQEIPGVRVHTVCVGPVNSPSTFWTLLSYARLALAARRQIRRLAPDVVNACFVPTHGAIAAFARCHPWVLSVWGADVIWDGPGPMPACRRRLVRCALRHADVICATSAFLAERTAPFAPPGKPIHRTPFGVDTERFRPADEPPARGPGETFRIGYTKTLAPKYGPDVLIRAMARIVEELPGARLVMAGRPLMRRELEKLAEELGIADRVELLGWVAHEDLPRLYRSFDVFAHPSVYQSESFGVSVLEASACGLPVVATRVGGVPEVCLDGRTGVLVAPNDPDALAEAILRLARDPQRRRELGRQGRQFVLDRYVWSDSVDIMLGHLARAVGAGPPGRPPRRSADSEGAGTDAVSFSRHMLRSCRRAFYVCRYRLLAPFAPRYEEATARFEGHAVTMRSRWGDAMIRAVRRGRFYESELLEYVYRRYGKGGVYVDLGAFIGNHSLFFGVVCEADLVVAVEPCPESFELLEHNLRQNGVTRARAHNVAVGDREAPCRMHIRHTGNFATNTVTIGENGDPAAVRMVPGDSLIGEPPKLIKIDTEGWPLPVLKGLEKTIRAHHPVIVVELYPGPVEPVERFLSDYGYTLQATLCASPTSVFE